VRHAFALLALLLLPGASWAGELSWRGHPKAECSSFMITESGFVFGIGGSTPNPYSLFEAPKIMPQVELGAMANVAPREAVGGAGFCEATLDGVRAGLRFRYRRWLSPTVGLDIEPGVALLGDHGGGELFPSFSGRMSVSVRDIAGLDLGLEQFRPDPGPSQTVVYFGLHFGAQPGAILMPIVGLVGGFYAAMSGID
jgi:hypothetical protein